MVACSVRRVPLGRMVAPSSTRPSLKTLIPMHVGEAYDDPGTALVPPMKIEDFRMTSISPAV